MKDFFDDEILIRYLMETASAEETTQIERWCALSSENQKTLEQLFFTLQAGNRLKIIQSANSDEALSRLKDRIRRHEKAVRRRILIQRLQRVAAILFLPVVLLSLWLLFHKDEMMPQYVDMYSNPGMVASFKLPDGSKVWLNGGSRLRYPTLFKGKSREVKMSGQGYFEVAHNAQQPFIVKAGKSFSLEVLGTSFNLSAYNDEDVIETTLVKGSVRLNMLKDGKMVQCMMKPNEKVIYIKEKGKKSVNTTTVTAQKQSGNLSINTNPESVNIATVDPKYDIAWKDHLILFKNHPMEEVIRRLGRYYNVQFIVKDNKVMNSEITGKFSNEQLPQIMEYLKIASGIKYKIIPATVDEGEVKLETVELWK